jgi:hypothetical protein
MNPGTHHDPRHHDDRRRFLKRSVFGVAALSMGSVLPGCTDSSDAVPGEIRRQLSFASPGEFLVLQAAAETFIDLPTIGGPLLSSDVAVRMDAYLAGADPEVQDQFHQLLAVFNSGIAAFLFDFRTSSFLGMTPDDRITYVQDWIESPIGFRRTAFHALKRVAMSCYYSHPASWPSIGFDNDRSRPANG